MGGPYRFFTGFPFSTAGDLYEEYRAQAEETWDSWTMAPEPFKKVCYRTGEKTGIRLWLVGKMV